MRTTITNQTTGETIEISRCVTAGVEQWVLDQTGCGDAVELQAMLDQYGAEAVGLGPDSVGIAVLA